MSAVKPIVKQLDHIVIRTGDPAALHGLLSGTFQLPVAWPIQAYPSFTSGGIAFGNVNLEILSCGLNPASQSREARIRAIVFESASLTETVRELGRRSVPHTPVLHYELKQPDGRRVAHWANVMLNKLVGDDPYLKLILFSTRLPGYMWMADKLRGSRAERQGVDRLFSGALVFLVEYFYQHFTHDPGWSEYASHEEKRAADLAALRERAGGALGVEAIEEVSASVKDLEGAQEMWQRLLAPAEPVAENVWQIADGPRVRLVAGAENEIKSLVWKVSSLGRAAEFLRSKGMLGPTTEKEVVIAPEKIYGLDVRLIE
jgi:hypothetical protein